MSDRPLNRTDNYIVGSFWTPEGIVLTGVVTPENGRS